MEVYLPQVRGGDEPFHTKLGASLKGNTKSLRETDYRDVSRGLSTPDQKMLCWKPRKIGAMHDCRERNNRKWMRNLKLNFSSEVTSQPQNSLSYYQSDREEQGFGKEEN